MDSLDDISDLSSDLSSPPASPSPPPDFYPSPPPSQDLDDASLSNTIDDHSTYSPQGHDTPPVKNRRKAEPKPRTTKRLYLTPDDAHTDQMAELDLLLKTLRKKRKIVVVAGAGISVAAGSKRLLRTLSIDWLKLT